MKCNNCGNELKPGAGFCENCGMIISVDGSAADNLSAENALSTENKAEFDAILGEEFASESSIGSDSLADDEAVAPQEEASVQHETPGDESFARDAGIEQYADSNADSSFEDIISFDGEEESEETYEAVNDIHADEAEESEDIEEIEERSSINSDETANDDGDSILIPPDEGRRSKKGAIAASIVVILLVAAGAAALTLKDGDFNLPSFFRKPTAPNSLSTTSDQTVTITTKKSTTEKTTESTTEKEDETEGSSDEKEQTRSTAQTETARVDNGQTSSASAGKTTSPASTNRSITSPGRTTSPSTTRSTTRSSTTQRTTAAPTTTQPTTARPTTTQPTTTHPTTAQPTTAQPTTAQPTTAQPTTAEPTTEPPLQRPEAIRKLNLPGVPANITLPKDFLGKSYKLYSSGESGVFLRSSPKSSAKAYGWARTGRELTVLGKDGDWLFVFCSYYGKYGWVKSTATSASQPTAKETVKVDGLVAPDTELSGSTKTVDSEGSVLYMRKGPSKDHERVLSLVDGTKLKILGKAKGNDNWLYVLEPMTGYYGWVFAGYVK